MRRYLVLALFLAVSCVVTVQAQEGPVVIGVTTIAGRGPGPFDGVPGIQANLDTPIAVAADSSGNLYIASAVQQRVFKVDASGLLTLIAGTGQMGLGGDGGPASDSMLCNPSGVAADAAGNVFIADTCNHRIRRVDAATRIIATVAGTGTPGFWGDGGPALSALLSYPRGVAVDVAGNVFIADRQNSRIRRVAASTGVITTVVGSGGTGFNGDGQPGERTNISSPAGLALDSAGNLYFADQGNQRVRRLDGLSGIVTTVAGNGYFSFYGDGGPATAGCLASPLGIAVDSAGNLFIADYYNNRIRKVDSLTGIISTVAGTGTPGFGGDEGPSGQALLNFPQAVAVGAAGDLFIADGNNNRVRRVASLSGTITTFAGTGFTFFGGDGQPATAATFNRPTGLVRDGAGNLFIADSQNHRVRRVDAGTGIITTVAGNGTPGLLGEGGPATEAELNLPTGLALDAAGNLYVADGSNNVIRKIEASSGTIRTVVGTGTAGFTGDRGPATSARLSDPTGVALDAAGNLFIADRGNNRVRRVDASSGVITTVAGNGQTWPLANGTPATSASLNGPTGVAVDGAGNLFIADTGHDYIMELAAASGLLLRVFTMPAPVAVGAGRTGEILAAGSTSLYHLDLLNYQTTLLASGFSLEGVAVLPSHGVLIADAAAGVIKKVETDYRPVAVPGPRQSFTCTSPGLSQVPLDGSGSSDRDGDPLVYTWTGAFPEGGGTVTGPDPTVSLPLGAPLVTLQVSDGMLVSQPAAVRFDVGVRIAGLELPLAPLVPYGEEFPPLRGKGFKQGSVLPLKLRFLCGDIPLTDQEISAPLLHGLVKTKNGPQAQPFISTVAGGGPDDVPALGASLLRPTAVATDRQGNVYIAVDGYHVIQQYQHRVFKVAPGGRLTVLAGDSNPYRVCSGIGGPARRAGLGSPMGLAVDGSGNVIIADSWCGLRRVDASTGVITTVGGAAPGSSSSGAGIPALDAYQDGSSSVAVDSSGNLYIANGAGVLQIDSRTGSIRTVVSLPGAVGVAVDSRDNLYIAGGGRVRFLDMSTGAMTIVAGNGQYGDAIEGAPATATPLFGPSSVAVDAGGNVFFADTDTDSGYDIYSRIRRVDAVTGILTTLFTVGGPDKSWYRAYPGIAVDAAGNLVAPDWSGARVVRWEASTGSITSIAGSGAGGGPPAPIPATGAYLYQVRGVSLDGQEDIAFLSNGRPFLVEGATGNIRGVPFFTYSDSLALTLDGILLVAHGSVVDRVDPITGAATRVAGDGTSGSGGDGGPATQARMIGRLSLALDGEGNLFIADIGDNRVRRVDAGSGIITTVAGGGSDWGDGIPATSAQLYLGYRASLALDGSGNLYISESYDLRRVDGATDLISTLDLGWRSAGALAADPVGNLYFGEVWGNTVYRRDVITGVISAVAGGNWGSLNDGGPATQATLSGVKGLALDGAGNLFIADSMDLDRWDYGNDLIRKVDGLGTAVDLVRTNLRPGKGSPGDFAFKYGGDGTWSFQLSTRSLSVGTYVAILEMPGGIRYALEPGPLYPTDFRYFDGAFALVNDRSAVVRLGGRPRPPTSPDPPAAIIRRR